VADSGHRGDSPSPGIWTRVRKLYSGTAIIWLNVCLLLVRTTPKEECEGPTQGMTLLLVDLKDPAVDITPIPKLGRNAVVSCEVRYDGLRVPVSRRVGEEGEGFRYLLDGLNPERILIASEALGIGRAALRRAVDYANSRVIGEHRTRHSDTPNVEVNVVGESCGRPGLGIGHVRGDIVNIGGKHGFQLVTIKCGNRYRHILQGLGIVLSPRRNHDFLDHDANRTSAPGSLARILGQRRAGKG